jgi:hypothetical protein
MNWMTPNSQLRRKVSCSRRRRRIADLLGRHATVLLAFTWLMCGMGRSQYQHTEYEVKAVYLYQFGRFVRWPASSQQGNQFSICVLGYDPFGPLLDSTVEGETLEGRPLLVRRISEPQQAAGCRIVFISSSEQNRIISILSALADKPMLTVSDVPGFCDHGGMIQFVLEGKRVRFAVNRAAAERAGLSFSSDLLRVATLVKNGPPGP